MIRTIRGVRVMLDRDLAKIYGVPTKALNQAVKRNRQRFPEDFMFQLTQQEAKALQASRSQFVTLKRGQNIKYLPYAFTEYGALMAANILNSTRAVQMNTTCGDAVGWTALSVWETGERSGERESTSLSCGPLRKCARRFAALPSSRGSSLHLRKSLLLGWTCMRPQSCRSCTRSCKS
jgi:ORF6N domain